MLTKVQNTSREVANDLIRLQQQTEYLRPQLDPLLSFDREAFEADKNAFEESFKRVMIEGNCFVGSIGILAYSIPLTESPASLYKYVKQCLGDLRSLITRSKPDFEFWLFKEKLKRVEKSLDELTNELIAVLDEQYKEIQGVAIPAMRWIFQY